MSRISSICSTPARASSPAIRRASTSRRRAPTRSTPSSTAISPPAASAGPAWGRSRSPASPTRWAGARSAGSPISSPRTWASRRRYRPRAPLLERAAHGDARGPARPCEMFDAIARGEIKALWVMATNPAVSLPRAGAVREALRSSNSSSCPRTCSRTTP